jgi:hypothetical protein
MNKVFANEFSEINYCSIANAVLMKWLPDNRHMSECEFWEQLNTLFITSEVFRTSVMYIDAFDFNYPILENTIKLIKACLERCPVKTFILVKSQNLLGHMNILRLISKIPFKDKKFTLFESREEGKLWFNVLIGMN